MGVSNVTNGGVTGSASGDYFARTSGGKMLFSTNDGVTAHALIDSSGNVGIGTSGPYYPFNVHGANIAYGSASTTGLFFDTTSATTGTGGGVAFGGYTNGTGGAVYHFGNIQGIKENATVGNGAGALLFSTRATGVAPTEAMRIDSIGNVLVGTTSTSLYNDISGGGINLSANGGVTLAKQSSSASDPILLLNNTGTDGQIVDFRKDGTTVGSIGVHSADRVFYTGASYGIAFDTSDVAWLPCTSTGGGTDGVVDLGKASSQFKDLRLAGNAFVAGNVQVTAGNGILLGGTATANKLDDYEEGTWTPVFGGTGVNPTVSASTYGPAEYVKVGKVVTASMAFFGDVTAAGSGAASIQGLPFQARGSRGVASIDYNSATANPTTGVSGYIEDNTTICYLHQGGSVTSESWAAGTAQRLFFSITYIVD
jgi:hypothetical protein